LPFKTPLDARYSDQIPEECRFDLEMLFASLKSFKVWYHRIFSVYKYMMSMNYT